MNNKIFLEFFPKEKTVTVVSFKLKFFSYLSLTFCITPTMSKSDSLCGIIYYKLNTFSKQLCQR